MPGCPFVRLDVVHELLNAALFGAAVIDAHAAYIGRLGGDAKSWRVGGEDVVCWGLLW